MGCFLFNWLRERKVISKGEVVFIKNSVQYGHAGTLDREKYALHDDRRRGPKLISFAYFIIVAHRIGVEASGKYAAALAFTSIFVVLVDFGFTIFLFVKARRSVSDCRSISALSSSQIVFAALAYLAMAGAVTLLGLTPYPASHRARRCDHDSRSWHLTLYGTLRTLGNLSYEAIGMVGSQLVTFILGTIFFCRPTASIPHAGVSHRERHECPLSHLILSIRYRVCPRPRAWPLLKRSRGWPPLCAHRDFFASILR